MLLTKKQKVFLVLVVKKKHQNLLQHRQNLEEPGAGRGCVGRTSGEKMASYKNSMGKFEWPGACPEPLTEGFRRLKKPAHGARTLFDNSLCVKLSRMQTNPYTGVKSRCYGRDRRFIGAYWSGKFIFVLRIYSFNCFLFSLPT
jgi:hypothetical protein